VLGPASVVPALPGVSETLHDAAEAIGVAAAPDGAAIMLPALLPRPAAAWHQRVGGGCMAESPPSSSGGEPPSLGIGTLWEPVHRRLHNNVMHNVLPSIHRALLQPYQK
jgi:hypothetical protein